MVYLAEKGKIDAGSVFHVFEILEESETTYLVHPIDLAVVKEMAAIERQRVKDMPDRLIAATARVIGCPLITKDPEIAALGNPVTVW